MCTVSRHRPDITMIVFVTIVIGRCCDGSVRRRSWLALAGIGLVVAAGVAAYGANSAVGKSNPREGVGLSKPTVSQCSALLFVPRLMMLVHSQELAFFEIWLLRLGGWNTFGSSQRGVSSCS